VPGAELQVGELEAWMISNGNQQACALAKPKLESSQRCWLPLHSVDDLSEKGLLVLSLLAREPGSGVALERVHSGAESAHTWLVAY
jgi:hypothetical protein